MALHFDHFYICLPDPAFESFIKNCEFLDLFEDRTTKRTDMEYRGLYLYFENQIYFEILQEKCGIKAGAIGVALSDLDNNNGLHKRIPFKDGLKVFDFDKNGKPWFKAIEPDFDKQADFFAWVMEYEPDFLEPRKRGYDQTLVVLKEIQIQGKVSEDEANASLSMYDSSIKINSHPLILYRQGAESKAMVRFRYQGKDLQFEV